MVKTNKQKCIEMWEYFVKFPWASKENYRKFLVVDCREEEFAYCWACEEAVLHPKYDYDSFCEGCCGLFCPVDWPGKSCMVSESPYAKWRGAMDNISAKKYAKQMVALIERTWKE